MKKVFLLIVVPALLVALGSAQTPATSITTDQTTIKGCLGGSEGNYTVVEDNTGHIFNITASSVDLKPHLSHDVTLVGQAASGASSAPAGNGFAVTELNMISEHCAAAAAASTAPVSTPPETSSTPAADATPPATPVTTPAETTSTPAVATLPAEIAITPAAVATPPVATVSTPAETAGTPAARPRRRSETPAAAAAPAVAASTPSQTPSTPATDAIVPVATDSSSSAPVSTPAVTTTPTATSKGLPLWLLIAFGVLVVAIGIMFPFVSRWRKRKSLERTGEPNLSFTREASSDQGNSDEQQPRKAA